MGTSRARRVGIAASLVTVLGVACGCGGSQDPAVRSAADRFTTAVASGDGAEACAVVAADVRAELEKGGATCADALLDEVVSQAGHAVSLSVFGTSAQVGYADDTIFLSRFPEGWRIIAAACTPTLRGVYDCGVTGS